MVKRIILYSLLLLVMLAQQPAAVLEAQAQLSITEVDLSQFPQVKVAIQHANQRSDNIKKMQILEEGKPQTTQIHSLQKVRVGVLADIYLGLNRDMVSKLALAVDGLDSQTWQWSQMERALFVPMGEDGHAISLHPSWTTDSWRIVSNSIAAYYNAEDETFKPKARQTALIDMMVAALAEYENTDLMQNHLLVLTDGFDKTSTTAIDAMVALAKTKQVQIHLVSYDRSVTSSSWYVLGEIAQKLATTVYTLSDTNDLSMVWQQIARQPLISKFTYQAQKAPPFPIIARIGETQSEAQVIPEIPAVKAEIIRPLGNERLTSARNATVNIKLDWGRYPPRALREIRYSIAGGRELIVKEPPLNAENIISFPLANISDGRPLLDIVIREKIAGFPDVIVQTRLHVALAPRATSIPTVTPTPSSTPTSTPTTIWDVGGVWIVTPIITRIPVEIRTNRTITQALPAILPSLVFAALVLAWIAWRRARRYRFSNENIQFPTQDPTTRKTTDVPLDSKPIAQLILIQGERSLPAIIPLYEGRTKFGRDPSWSDELLPNRFVSLQQFAISISNDYHNLGNYSERNHTSVDGILAREGLEGDLEQGSPLRSGSIIQFGPFKYKFQLITQFDSADYQSNGQVAAPRGTANV